LKNKSAETKAEWVVIAMHVSKQGGQGKTPEWKNFMILTPTDVMNDKYKKYMTDVRNYQ
jgi:hypothetical protein